MGKNNACRLGNDVGDIAGKCTLEHCDACSNKLNLQNSSTCINMGEGELSSDGDVTSCVDSSDDECYRPVFPLPPRSKDSLETIDKKYIDDEKSQNQFQNLNYVEKGNDNFNGRGNGTFFPQASNLSSEAAMALARLRERQEKRHDKVKQKEIHPSEISIQKKTENSILNTEKVFWEMLNDHAVSFFFSLGLNSISKILSKTSEELGPKYAAWRSMKGLSRSRSPTDTVDEWRQEAVAFAQERSNLSGSQPTQVSDFFFHLSDLKRKRKRSTKLSDDSMLYYDDIKRTSGNEKKVCEALSRQPDDLCAMNEISHLTKTILRNNRLPMKLITVMNVLDETLYSFRVEIRPSLIPNSGYGAFLTFLGARRLKAKSKRATQSLMRDRYALNVPIVQSIDCKNPDGTFSSVSLTGNNLLGNGNSPYFTITRFPLYARIPSQEGFGSCVRDTNANESKIQESSNDIRIWLRGNGIHEDIDLLRDEQKISHPVDGIGHFHMHSETDYETDDGAEFCSYDKGCGLVDLGRYGPFHKKDRKTQLEFNIKDFIFDYEPAGWNFGVSERLKGIQQVIDITDDSTGEPHLTAKEDVPMYVNEIGHNKSLVQNVLAREKDGRIVHYYLHLSDRIKKGETVELLVCYTDSYEDTRERKGYGRENLDFGLQGDDDDNQRLKRNLIDRKSIVDTICDMNLEEISQILCFIKEHFLKSVVSSTEWFVKKANLAIKAKSPYLEKFLKLAKPSTRQWIARRRLHWLADIFEKRCTELLDISSASSEIVIGGTFEADMLMIKEVVNQMHWHSMWSLLPIFKLVRIKDCSTLLLKMIHEILEEDNYKVSEHNCLIHTHDPIVWCKVARDLVMEVTESIATLAFTPLSSRQRDLKQLLSKLYSHAFQAGEDIKKACENLNRPNASSEPGFKKSLNLLGFEAQSDESESFYMRSLTSSTELEGLYDCLSFNVSNIDDEISCSNPRFTSSKTKEINIDDSNGISKQMNRLTLVVSKRKLSNHPLIVNVDEEFYLSWQVIRIVHFFATKCVAWVSKCDDSIYSLEKLCRTVGIRVEAAKKMLEIEMPIFDPLSKRAFECCNRGRNDIIDNASNSAESISNESMTSNDIAAKEMNSRPNCEIIKNGLLSSTSTIISQGQAEGFPPGWIEQHSRARSNPNLIYKYYFSPLLGKRFRSRVEVTIFLEALKLAHGDELKAIPIWSKLKSRKKH